MLIRSLALATSVAWTTQAFLIPSSISDVIPGIEGKADVLPDLQQNGILLKLECPECSTAHSHSHPEFVPYHDESSALVLNFTVVGPSNKALHLNGVQIYPHIIGAVEPMSAPQIGSGQSLGEYVTMKHELAAMGIDAPMASARLGYALMAQQSRPSHDLKDQIISLSFRVVEVGDVFVSGLDRVDLTMIRTDNDELILLNAEKSPVRGDVSSPAERGHAGEAKECSRFPLLCKWKALAAGKFHGMKSSFGGCRKSRPEHQVPPRFRHHQSHGSHHHRRPHRVAFLLRRVVLHVIVPVLIGIVAGMMASMVGMIVGQLVVLVWRRLSGRSPRVRRETIDDESDALPAESKGLLEDAELPEYEEAPQYEDVVAIVIEDEKK
ncbi:MAG: hypothetical protein M1817_000840 [Caeruleum heppii]|nr:MAG: hypothetical protein M1817_000840 [Caeruleum heppii]